MVCATAQQMGSVTLCDFIKRHMTLHAADEPSVMDSVQLFMDLSASINDTPIREALSRDEAHWFQQALDYRDIKIIQTDIADATKLTQSKISRILQRTTDPAGEELLRRARPGFLVQWVPAPAR